VKGKVDRETAEAGAMAARLGGKAATGAIEV